MIEILRELTRLELQGKNSESLEAIAERIIRYYNDNGRHLYSEVSSFIYQIKEEDFEYIIENLLIIKEYYNAHDLGKYGDKIFKLIDHIQLEIGREEHIKKDYQKVIQNMVTETSKDIKTFDEKIYQELNSKYERINNEYKEMNDAYKEINKKSSSINKTLKAHRKNLDNLYTSIISILGIFAAIVIAFFGGLSILGSVLQNMHSVSKYRLVFTVLLISFFMFNIIFMLLYTISKLIDKDINSRCNNDMCANCNKRANIACLKEKYPLLFWYNLICGFLMLSISGMYTVGKYSFVIYIMNSFKIKSSSLIPVVELGIIISIFVLFLICYLVILGIRRSINKHKKKASITYVNDNHDISS